MAVSPSGSRRALRVGAAVGALLACAVGARARDAPAGAVPSRPEARLAVASNFVATARALAERFATDSEERLVLVSGATGKLYAQIRNGARLDAFLAADSESPARLERDGFAVAGSRFTYARGRLALWSQRPGYVDDGGRVLATGGFRHLAIANPRLAPYGRAARETLEALGLWAELAPGLVRGENIAQTYQFVASGNAELGFVAYSQLVAAPGSPGSFWLVPEPLHSPIDQQAVLLTGNATAERFLRFLAGDAGRAIVESHGYAAP